MAVPLRILNIYLVKRTGEIGWDEYESFVVCCETEQDARETFPDSSVSFIFNNSLETWIDPANKTRELKYHLQTWIPGRFLNTLNVTFIGIADAVKKGVILSSFNAG